MSVAEKLKALIERPVGSHAEYLRAANELADALPQIVAVVEAAEQREAVHVLNVGAESGMASLLRALDEKLASDR